MSIQLEKPARLMRPARNRRGLTLLEVTAVLVVMSILMTVVVERLMNIETVSLSSRVETLKSHIRYAQAMAMKRNNTVWGIKSDGSAYWLFKTDDPDTATEPDANQVVLPAEDLQAVTAPGINTFTVYFDQYGIPHTYDTANSRIEPITSPLTIQIDTESFTIAVETGYIA